MSRLKETAQKLAEIIAEIQQSDYIPYLTEDPRTDYIVKALEEIQVAHTYLVLATRERE